MCKICFGCPYSSRRFKNFQENSRSLCKTTSFPGPLIKLNFRSFANPVWGMEDILLSMMGSSYMEALTKAWNMHKSWPNFCSPVHSRSSDWSQVSIARGYYWFSFLLDFWYNLRLGIFFKNQNTSGVNILCREMLTDLASIKAEIYRS